MQGAWALALQTERVRERGVGARRGAVISVFAGPRVVFSFIVGFAFEFVCSVSRVYLTSSGYTPTGTRNLGVFDD